MGFSHITEKATQAATSIVDGPKAMLYCYRYTLIFNEQKILKQWKREECAREPMLRSTPISTSLLPSFE